LWRMKMAYEDIKFAATMLRQQAQEIEALKKELALQKLSDIGQEIETLDKASTGI